MNKQYNRPGLTSRLRHLALAAVLATGAAGAAHAQTYTAANAVTLPGTYTDLGTTGSAIATANNDDANSASTPIGFTFTLNGTAFTDFVLNTNGFIKLGTAAPAAPFFSTYAQQAYTGGPLNSTTENNLVLPFNTDLEAGASGTEYRVATTGTSPNRVCTIQWKNVSDKTRLAVAGGGNIDKQFANISFQVKLYETSNTVDFVYNTATPSTNTTNANFIVVGLKGSSSATAQVITAIKASNDAWSATTFQQGVYASTTNAHNIRATATVTGATPLPDAGRTYRFALPTPNDAAVQIVYGYDKVAVPAGQPFTIQAVIRNAGTAALTNVVASLNVTGANTFTAANQTVASLAVGATAVVSFPNVTVPNVGNNTVTVSVPSDNNNTNNSYDKAMETSATTFSYFTPGGNANSVFGFTGEAYNAAKITLTSARAITSVRALISEGTPSATTKTSVGESVYGVVIDATTGALLARSANYVITAADINVMHTFTLAAPVTVPAGDVLVGMAQVATTSTLRYFPFGVQNEVPTRVGTFFSGSPTTAGAPAEAFTGATAVFKLPYEAVTAAAANNDVAVNEIQGYGSVAVPVGNPISMRAVVRNAGAAALTNVVVTLNVTGANTATVTQTVPSLAVGASTQVTFTGINLTTVGANTVTVSVPADDNTANNSVAQPMATSATRFSFITPGATQTSSFGFTPNTAARTLAFCGKFTVNAPRDVTAVRAVLGQDATLVSTPTTVYGVVLNATTGAVIARSADYLITTADLGQLHTFTLTGSVPAGDFLVGLAQVLPIGTSANQVFPMAYEAETPARPGTFYTASITTPAAPTDAAANNARFMLEAETAAPATCLVPTALAVTGTTATSVSISFTGRTGAIGYQIVYGPQGFTPGATSLTTPTFTTTTFTVTGLNAATTYDFYIRTICSATDQSGLAGPVRATTACTPPTIATFPYTENFDAIATGQTLPCGITVSDNNTDGFTWQARGSVATVPNSTSIARSGANAMVYAFNSADPTVGADDWFYTPALTLSATQRYRLSFYYRGPVASGSNVYVNALQVKYGATATPAGLTTTLYTNNNITTSTYLQANNTSTPVVADITPTAGNFYVGFHALSGGDQGFLAVDDVVITAGPLATSEALKRSVSVFPNPSTTGTFNLEIHGANAKQGLIVEVSNMLGQRVYTGTAKDNFSNTVNLSSLASGIYSIKVRNGEEYTQQQISIVK